MSEILKLNAGDINKEKLEISWISEKIKTKSDLKSLYEDILGKEDNDVAEIDLSKVNLYLKSLKDKEWNDIESQGGALTFAVQLFLKSQGLYKGKIDGIYLNKGQSESKTRQAVKQFQHNVGINEDGRAGKETIKKIIESLDKFVDKYAEKVSTKPENTKVEKPVGKKEHSLHFEISSEFGKLTSENQKLFWEGKYTIESNGYFYFFANNEIQKSHDSIDMQERLLKDSQYKKSKNEQSKNEQLKEKSNIKEVFEKKPFKGSVDSRDRNDVRKYIKEIYNSGIDLDYLLESDMVFESLRTKFLEKNKDTLSKDPYINSYMLYKSMKGIGTNKKVVGWIFENYSGDWDVLENVFGTPDGDSLMQRLDSDYSDKGLVKLFQSKLSPGK